MKTITAACLLALAACGPKAEPPAPLQTAAIQESPMPQSQEVTTPSGLKYTDLIVGKGESPKQGQTVVVHYTGTLTDGSKFDSSLDRNKPFKFKIGMGQVIKGWDEGVMTMKVGGSRRLRIPSDLAYGDRGYPGAIPPKATLLFDVQLLALE